MNALIRRRIQGSVIPFLLILFLSASGLFAQTRILPLGNSITLGQFAGLERIDELKFLAVEYTKLLIFPKWALGAFGSGRLVFGRSHELCSLMSVVNVQSGIGFRHAGLDYVKVKRHAPSWKLTIGLSFRS